MVSYAPPPPKFFTLHISSNVYLKVLINSTLAFCRSCGSIWCAHLCFERYTSRFISSMSRQTKSRGETQSGSFGAAPVGSWKREERQHRIALQLRAFELRSGIGWHFFYYSGSHLSARCGIHSRHALPRTYTKFAARLPNYLTHNTGECCLHTLTHTHI